MFQLISTLRIYSKTVSVFGLLVYFFFFFFFLLYSFSQNNRYTGREGKGNEISCMQADPYLPDLGRKPVTSQHSSIVQIKSSLWSYFKSFVSQWSCEGVRAPLGFTSTQTWKQFSPGCSEKEIIIANCSWGRMWACQPPSALGNRSSHSPGPSHTRDGFNCHTFPTRTFMVGRAMLEPKAMSIFLPKRAENPIFKS